MKQLVHTANPHEKALVVAVIKKVVIVLKPWNI